MRLLHIVIAGLLVLSVLPTAGARIPVPPGIEAGSGGIVFAVSDKGANPNEDCLKNAECKAALEAYFSSRTKRVEAETAYKDGIRGLFRDAMRAPDFQRAVSEVKTRLKVLEDFSGQLQKWIVETNTIYKFAKDADTAIRNYQEEIGDQTQQSMGSADRSSRVINLNSKDLLSEEKAKLLSLVDLINAYKGEDSRHGPALPLAELKNFKDKAAAANLDHLKGVFDRANSAVKEAGKKACELGAVIKDECPATTAPTASAPVIQIIRADYGDLKAGSAELGRDPVGRARHHTCDATSYFRFRCQFAPYVAKFCTQRTTTADGGVKIEIKQCPPECKQAEGCNEHVAPGVSRVSRQDPVCAVDVSVKDVCGGFNPAPTAQRAVLVQYKCGADAANVGKAWGRDGERVHLECPLRRPG